MHYVHAKVSFFASVCLLIGLSVSGTAQMLQMNFREIFKKVG